MTAPSGLEECIEKGQATDSKEINIRVKRVKPKRNIFLGSSLFHAQAKEIVTLCVLAFLFVGEVHAQSFSNTGSMHVTRAFHTATLLNDGTVLIVGGENSTDGVYSTAELYNPSTGTFTYTAGRLKTARFLHSATLLQNGTVLIAGGYGQSGILSSAEIYDPTTQTFSVTGSLNTGRVYNSAVLLQNGQVLIAGGTSNGGGAILSTAELYNPATGTFSYTNGNMTSTRENLWRLQSSLLSNGMVLFEGGWNGHAVVATAELYDPTTQTFAATGGNLSADLWYQSATAMEDGTLLIAAGDNLGGFSHDAWVYNPSTEIFSSTGNLTTARIDHTATLLENGMTLITGGYGKGAVILTSAELYDPSSSTFSSTASLNTARTLHTATLLNDGTVLIVGGYNGSTTLSSAEIFSGVGTNPTTYYISYSSGSNSNSGTSESSPWKTHPYMQSAAACTGSGSAPSYLHSAGDHFVFKQGDSWPNACFDMVIQEGGASAGDPDVYTYDPTWGTPGGTTGNISQPVGTYQFTAGGAVINGSDGSNTFVYDDEKGNITFNGVELTGMTWDASSVAAHPNTPQSAVTMFNVQEGTNFILSNCYAHGWTYTNSATGGDALFVMVGNGNPPFSAGTELTGCVIDGANSGGSGVSNSGGAAYAIPICDNNIIENMTNGCLLNANGVAHDNQIGPINQSFDSAVHENCIEPIDLVPGGTSDVYIYSNVTHDCTGVNIITQGTSLSGANENDYIWNNVLSVGSITNVVPINCDNNIIPSTGSSCHVWNNTIYAETTSGLAGTDCIRTGGRVPVTIGGVTYNYTNLGTLDVENNFCITDVNTNSFTVLALIHGVTGNSYTYTTNVLMDFRTAATDGISSSETYAYQEDSTCGGNPTDCPVGVGTNLTSLASGPTASLAKDTTYGGTRTANTRPASGAWDAGAYEH